MKEIKISQLDLCNLINTGSVKGQGIRLKLVAERKTRAKMYKQLTCRRLIRSRTVEAYNVWTGKDELLRY